MPPDMWPMVYSSPHPMVLFFGNQRPHIWTLALQECVEASVCMCVYLCVHECQWVSECVCGMHQFSLYVNFHQDAPPLTVWPADLSLHPWVHFCFNTCCSGFLGMSMWRSGAVPLGVAGGQKSSWLRAWAVQANGNAYKPQKTSDTFANKLIFFSIIVPWRVFIITIIFSHVAF